MSREFLSEARGALRLHTEAQEALMRQLYSNIKLFTIDFVENLPNGHTDTYEHRGGDTVVRVNDVNWLDFWLKRIHLREFLRDKRFEIAREPVGMLHPANVVHLIMGVDNYTPRVSMVSDRGGMFLMGVDTTDVAITARRAFDVTQTTFGLRDQLERAEAAIEVFSGVRDIINQVVESNGGVKKLGKTA